MPDFGASNAGVCRPNLSQSYPTPKLSFALCAAGQPRLSVIPRNGAITSCSGLGLSGALPNLEGDEFGRRRRCESNNNVHDPLVHVVLRCRRAVSLDEVRFARGLDGESALAENVVHEDLYNQPDLPPARAKRSRRFSRRGFGWIRREKYSRFRRWTASATYTRPTPTPARSLAPPLRQKLAGRATPQGARRARPCCPRSSPAVNNSGAVRLSQVQPPGTFPFLNHDPA